VRPFAPVRAGPPTAVPRADPVRGGAALDPGPAIASGKQPLDPGLAQLEDAGGRGRDTVAGCRGGVRTRPGARPRRCASSTRVPWARPSQCRSTRAGSRRRVRCHCHQARTRRRRDAKQPLMSSCTPQGAARSAPSWSHSRRYWRVVCQPRPRLCRAPGPRFWQPLRAWMVAPTHRTRPLTWLGRRWGRCPWICSRREWNADGRSVGPGSV